jgi:hypothetical protein
VHGPVYQCITRVPGILIVSRPFPSFRLIPVPIPSQYPSVRPYRWPSEELPSELRAQVRAGLSRCMAGRVPFRKVEVPTQLPTLRCLLARRWPHAFDTHGHVHPLNADTGRHSNFFDLCMVYGLICLIESLLDRQCEQSLNARTSDTNCPHELAWSTAYSFLSRLKPSFETTAKPKMLYNFIL